MNFDYIQVNDIPNYLGKNERFLYTVNIIKNLGFN